jgi:hypothetical protein
MALTKVRGGGVDSLFDDEDSNIIIGRGRIGNTISASDHASFQHRDLSTGSNLNYAILQTASGGTQINSSSGQSLFINIGNSQAIKVDSDKIITMENQPAFQAKVSSSQSNIANDTLTTVTFGSEVFDQNADFSSTTFTAPVTGKYQLNILVDFRQLDNASNNLYNVYINTSNRDYQHSNGGADTVHNYHTIAFSVVADMDANDTALVKVLAENQSSATMDVGTNTNFSGCLLA